MESKLESKEEKFSYVLGRQVGGDFTRQNITVDVDAFAQGLKSVYEGNESALSESESLQILKDFEKSLNEKKLAGQKEAAEKNIAQAEEFFARNAKESDVTVTDSGIHYRILQEGSGENPSATANVKTHYEGALLDGQVFDSSYKRGEPATFPLNAVIQGWQEVIQLMKVGSIWEVFIPENLAYGQAGSPPVIGPSQALRFKIELLDIVK